MNKWYTILVLYLCTLSASCLTFLHPSQKTQPTGRVENDAKFQGWKGSTFP